MKYLALLLIAVVLATVSGSGLGCAKQDAVIARVSVDFAFNVLSKTYAAESARAQSLECQAWECYDAANCPSADECPSQLAIERKWQPVWTAYEMLATAVELGDSDAARQSYCKLKVAAAVLEIPLPVPAYECTK